MSDIAGARFDGCRCPERHAEEWRGHTLYEWIGSFDFVWASPPCQAFTRNARQKGTAHKHENLIPPVRALLDAAGLPYVMENVPDAPLRKDLLLCGSMFDLRLVRHRIFEVSGFAVSQPEHAEHRPDYITVTGHAGGSSKRDGGEHFGNTAEWREAMGIDWMPGSRLVEAVPPAYSEHIGRAAMVALERARQCCARPVVENAP